MGTLSTFRRSTDGNIALLTALLLPVALALGGAAVDFARYNGARGDLHEFADALAIRGAKELALAGANSDSIARVVRAAATGRLGDALEIGTFEIGVAVSMKEASVTVTLTQPAVRALLLSHVSPFGEKIAVSSTAVSRGGSNLCVVALNGGVDGAFEAAMASKIDATGCTLVSNSTSSAGVRVSGSSTIKANQTCSVGGYSGPSTAFTPAPLTDCPPIPNPLEKRATPSVGGCDFTNTMIGDRSKTTAMSALTASLAELAGRATTIQRTPYTLSPGVYCGGLAVGSNASATLEPGVYVMKDGPLVVDLNGEIKGVNVGFYLTGDASTFTFSPDSKIDLTAPKDGPLSGVLFFEDPTSRAGRTHSILSNDARNLLGTFYLPKGTLFVSTISPVADRSAYTAIVADRIRLLGAPTLVLNSNYGLTDVPVPQGLGPVGGEVYLRN